MLVSTGLEQLDNVLGGEGYPERSSILVTGPPGVGKEALGYWFIRSGITAGDFCLYATRLSVSEVLEDLRAFKVSTDSLPYWIASQGGNDQLDMNDLTALSVQIKETIRKNSPPRKRSRIVTDILSPLLILNPPTTIYRLFSQLLTESKQNNSVFLATIEEGMHQPEVLASMQQLFDGVLELRLFEEGGRVDPLFRVRKMRGLSPQPRYFRYAFTKGKMEIMPFVK